MLKRVRDLRLRRAPLLPKSVCSFMILKVAEPSEADCYQAELINLGNAELKTPASRITKKNLLEARNHFIKALQYLQNDPATSPKQVARVCQKLLEATLGLSQIVRLAEERMQYAEQARRYGEIALENVIKSEDQCMAAQVEFLLACITAWKVYLQMRDVQREPSASFDTDSAQLLLSQRMEQLRGYSKLDMTWYEGQVRTYAGYLTG